MLIAHELLLCCLDDGTGRISVARRRLNPALGAALMVELVLGERIAIVSAEAPRAERGRVRVLSQSSTDDAELDWILEHLQTWGDLRVTQVVAEVGGPLAVDRLAHRLVEAGVLAGAETEDGVSGSWWVRDVASQREIRIRICAALADQATPSERTVALVSLLAGVGGLESAVRAVDPTADHQDLQRRARELSHGDWAVAAVRDLVVAHTTWSVFRPWRS